MKVYYIICSSDNQHSASLNRVRLFVSGLKKQGIDSDLIIFDVNKRNNVIINKFFYLIKILKFVVSFLLLPKSILVFYGESPFFRFWKYIKLKHLIFVERTEFPTYLIERDRILSNKEIRFYKNFEKSLRFCSGFITCSKELSNYYQAYLKDECKIFISPLIVDIGMFIKEKNVKIFNKISYCGDWGNQKDGVDILIKAFAKIHDKYPELRLELIGGSTIEIENSLKELAVDLKINEFIDFVGRVPHLMIPKYLNSAKILALARPNNKQAAGGIPSKIAEYLSTGRPVVLTNVGELHYYLCDQINCYMSKPDSIDAFAGKLEQALTDKNADIIGQNGYEIAKQFDVNVQTNLLINYFCKYVSI